MAPLSTLVACALTLGWVALPPASAAQDAADQGKAVYDRWCAECHGVDGAGDGPAAGYMMPRPRDFTLALYQIRTTATGQLPTDDDILKMIDEGMPGTAMPAWEDVLSRDERLAVVEYIKGFSAFFANSPTPEQLSFGGATRPTEAGIEQGRELWEQIECWRCHGQTGRGDGSSAPTLEDDLDFPIRAADLTENWLFNGGGTVEDIYRALRTGLDGTPMPSNSDMLDAGVWTEEQLWNLAHYVRSLAPEDPPAITEVIGAERLEDAAVPTSVDDPAWSEAQSYYVPLVGQIIVKPRWFDPRVDGVWVQALHDGQALALRVVWNDPSHSPDPDWADWRSRITEAMEPVDDTPHPDEPLPDRIAVQFPVEVPQGMERPYFLFGTGRDPVNLWDWTSDQAGAREMVGRGIGALEEQPPESQGTSADATWDNGQWRVLFTRALATDDPASDVQFPMSEAVPVAFFAWDGDNGESGARSSVSSWYFVYLTEPTPPTVLVAPLLAMALTAGLGLVVVARAQRREDEDEAAEGTGDED